MRLRKSQAVSRMHRALMTLLLRLVLNDDFSFESSITCSKVLPGFMGKSLEITVRSLTERNHKTRYYA